MTLPPGNSEFGSSSAEEPLFGEPQTTSDVYATPLDVAPVSARPDYVAGDATSSEDSSATDAAKAKTQDAAAGVKDKAQDAKAGVKDKAAALKDSPTGQKANAAKEQAGTVVAEAGNQAKNLVGQARTQLGSQAETQQQKVAQGVHGLADTLRQRAESQGGLGGTAAKQAGDRVDGLASYLEQRTPAEVFADVNAFASKRPSAFVAIAGVVGVLGGRVVRALRDEAKPDVPATSDTDTDTSTGDLGYATPVTGTPSGLGAASDQGFGSVGSVDAGLETGGYAAGSYATSADPLTYEDGELR